jgi:hypothetical protein
MNAVHNATPDPSLSRLAEARTSSARQALANAAKSEIASASLAACAELVKDDALLTQGASTATAATHSPAERLSLYRERVLAHLELQKAGHAQYNAEEAAVDDLRFHREKLSVASTKPEFSILSDCSSDCNLRGDLNALVMFLRCVSPKCSLSRFVV